MLTTSTDTGNPCVMVIFGASGDLTRRKLIPALYHLAKDNLLSREFALVGFARPELTHEQFRERCSEEVRRFGTAAIDPSGDDRRARRPRKLDRDALPKYWFARVDSVGRTKPRSPATR
jgi:hypothetical protein